MLSSALRRGALVVALWSLAGLAGAQVILGTAQVQAALQRQVQVWDVRGDKEFAKGHLPGALTVGDAAAVLRDANAEDFLAVGEIAKILGAAGIDPARETIVYGARGSWNPYFGRYALRYFGATQVSVYHEGLEGWQAADLPVEVGAAKAAPIQLALSPNRALAVTTQDMLARLGRADVQIVDARTPKHFIGGWISTPASGASDFGRLL